MQLLTGELSDFTNRNLKNALFQPVSIISTVVFRIVFGSIMLWEVTRYFSHDWIYRYWVEPKWNFSYGPFHFTPLPETYMYLVWYALGILAFFIIIGLFYRASTVLFFCLFTYTYLLEQGRYLNHFYLVVVISCIMIFIPANKAFSVDARIWKNIKTSMIPSYNLWLLRSLIAIPYFFGGVAKINPDWLQGYPLAIWLQGDTDFPIIGQYFTEHWMILFLSYSGLLLDLLIVPFLLKKKTRIPAFLFITLFHLMNSRMFTIGIFPWFMIFGTTIFFPPDWPKQLTEKLFGAKYEPLKLESYKIPSSRFRKIALIGLYTFFGIQTFLPFRHWLIPGNVHWTEGGHRYAWHMKLRSKSGYTDFFVVNKANGERVEVNLNGYIEDWQIDDMDGKPYMIWEFANYLKEDYALMGIDVEVYADARASLNGRLYQQIISPDVDLTSVPKPIWGYAKWILPLTVPLDQQR